MCAIAPDVPPAAGVTITVNVAHFRNTKGYLGCSLFRSPKGFPEGSEDAVAQRLPVDAAVMRIYTHVAPGRYAVPVVHDENDNGKLDKNPFGVPTEGCGGSNNHTYALRSPAVGGVGICCTVCGSRHRR